MPLGTPRRRRRARRELQRAIEQLATSAETAAVNVWRIQPVIEVCGPAHYAEWRRARERAWKRDRSRWHTRTWPDRLLAPQSAAVLLPQAHGGHWRGKPAEIAMPMFTTGIPKTGRDIEHSYEVHALALLLSWASLAITDAAQTALLAPPLVDLIGRRPQPRIPCDLGLSWPLPPSEPHIKPPRRA
jgi:hypothetical protein